MRIPAVILALILLFGATGCEDDVLNVVVAVETIPDLHVQVWDRHLGAPYQGAFVEVIQTNDGSHTDSAGWTDWLLVPRNAGRVQLSVSFYDERWNPQTVYPWITLRHGDTEVRIDISTRAPR